MQCRSVAAALSGPLLLVMLGLRLGCIGTLQCSTDLNMSHDMT